MEYINCVVDTQPMANELKSVSNHVTGTTTAVVAMQAAVIKADQDAADRVCHDVNRGFHALMSSQLSQKIAKLQSDVDSHLLRLTISHGCSLIIPLHLLFDIHQLLRLLIKS